MHWDMPVTENPVIDSTEIWEIVNTTEDSHPIHLHLVRFQILDRRTFDEAAFFRTRQIRYTGPVDAARALMKRAGKTPCARIRTPSRESS